MAQNGFSSWQLGSFRLDTPWVLAPVAGFTHWPFQVICRRRGMRLTFTPMICARALKYLSSRSATLKLLDWDDSCGPVAVQLFGDDPQEMAQAARCVVERGAALVDINMGCTVPKILKKRAGSYLLREPELACRIVQAVLAAVDGPVTVKLRLGIKEGDGRGWALAQVLADLGVAALFVHGRYAEQGFGGRADVAEVGRWARALPLPVVGNGDVLDYRQAELWLEAGCAAVMVGRGLLGDPWLVGRLEQARLHEEFPPIPSVKNVVATIAEHWELSRRYRGLSEGQMVQEFRSHLAQYCRKQRCLQPWREALLSCRTEASLLGVLQDIV